MPRVHKGERRDGGGGRGLGTKLVTKKCLDKVKRCIINFFNQSHMKLVQGLLSHILIQH